MANGFKPVQLSYTNNPREAVLGQLVEGFSPYRADSRIARGFIRAGFGVFLSSPADARDTTQSRAVIDCGEVFHIPNGASGSAASTTSVHSGASSASVQTITAFNGVLGAAEIQPPRALTFTFDSSTDWDPTTGTVTFVNEAGDTVTENLAVATSAALTTSAKAKSIVKVVLPAQTGAAGTFTIGTAAVAAPTIQGFAGVAIRQMLHRALTDDLIYGLPGYGSGGPASYVDGEGVPCLTSGGIYVASEAAVADGDPVYVRTAVSGSNLVLGAFSNAAGTGLTLVPNAKFKRGAAAPPSTSLYRPAWAAFLGV
jgi:hypothetical protein